MDNESVIKYEVYLSPCGPIILGSHGDSLCLCVWTRSRKHENVIRKVCNFLHASIESGESDIIRKAKLELDEYFEGRRKEFTIPLLFAGSEFQIQVWNALLDIPYGKTVSYKGIADKIERPTAIRAVSGAVGSNPISIFNPCHRVIGIDNTLTGYAGGLDVKKFILSIEGIQFLV